MFAKYPQQDWIRIPNELIQFYNMSICTRAVTISEMLPLLENQIHGPYIKQNFFADGLIVTDVDSVDFIKATIQGVIPSVRWALVSNILERPRSFLNTDLVPWVLAHPEYTRNLQRVGDMKGHEYISLIRNGLDVKNYPDDTWKGKVLIEALKHGMPLLRKRDWFLYKVESYDIVLDFVLKNKLLTMEYAYHYMDMFGSIKTLEYFLDMFFDARLPIDLVRLICSFVDL